MGNPLSFTRPKATRPTSRRSNSFRTPDNLTSSACLEQSFNLLYNLSQLLTRKQTVQEQAQTLLAEICQTLQVPVGFMVVQSSSQKTSTQILASFGLSEKGQHILDEYFATNSHLNDWLQQANLSVLIEDVAQHTPWPAIFTEAAASSVALTLPLIACDARPGTLTLIHEDPAFFHETRVKLLEAASAIAGTAISNAQLLQQNRRMNLTERLQETVPLINSSLETQKVLELILDQLGHVFPYESGSIQTLDGDAMRVVAVRNQPPSIVGRQYTLKDHTLNRQLAQGETIIINDIKNWGVDWVPYDDDIKISSCLGVPLWIRDRVIGALTIDSSTVRTYTEEDVEIIQAFAQQAATALENARLFQEQRTQRELTEALAEAAAVVGSTLEHEQVLDRILEQAARVVHGDIFNILMIFGKKGRFVRWRGYERFGISDDELANFEIPVFEYPKLVEMIDTGKPVLVEDILESPDWVRSNPYRDYLRSYIAAPIRISEETKGFLNVNGTRPYQFSTEDAQRLKIFADYAAITLQNANLFQQQRDYAGALEKQVRKRTLQLEAQNAWLQAILSSTADGIIVTDGDGKIVQKNRVVDKWINEILTSEDIQSLYEAIHTISHQTERRTDVLLELTGLDLQLSSAPISDQGTEGPATVIAVHNVSYLKELDRMKSRFVSNVSHELRTPITSIRLYASLIRNSDENRREQYLESLNHEADRLSRLVEDILKISHLESGKMTLNLQPMDLNVLAETVVANHMVLAETRNLNMTYQCSTLHANVLIDPDKFTQVLNNLIENAIHYTPSSGHIHIITAQQTVDGKRWGMVIVQDTGMGISEDEIEYVFERFYRGEEPKKMQIPGSGLGLAIVKEILQLHGGDIEVQSKVGKGTTFTVRIPFADDA